MESSGMGMKNSFNRDFFSCEQEKRRNLQAPLLLFFTGQAILSSSSRSFPMMRFSRRDM